MKERRCVDFSYPIETFRNEDWDGKGTLEDMKHLFLIRHGRQCSKRCNVDVSLDGTGRKQAELLGGRLRSYGIEKLYSSELVRARETAQIVQKIISVPHEILPDIQEIDFGGFTGKTDEEIRTQYAEFCAQRFLHQDDLSYPEGGECGADVAARAMPQLQKLCRQKENRIAIVTHGGVIRSVCASIIQTEQKHKLKFAVDMENTSITHLIFDEEREIFFLERFNDFAHLEGHEELLRKNWKTSLEKRIK